MENQDIIIKKYLDGSSTGEEERILYDWISRSEENLAEFRRIKRGYDRVALLTAEADSPERARRKIDAKIMRRSRRRRRVFAAAASAMAAAVIAGVVMSGWLGREAGTAENGIAYQTERGERKEVVLPDGSTVTLNAESKVSYIFEEERGMRQVFLTGEAFFDVVRDTLNPFIVRTDHMDARVLGTRFNISAYPESRAVEATIMEGRVALTVHGSGAAAVEVTANDRATLVKGTAEFRLDRVDASLIGQWMNGALVFREAFLGDIAGTLQRYYDIPVRLADRELATMVYTATFDKDTPVEKILDIFAYTSPIEYAITDDGIVITLKPTNK